MSKQTKLISVLFLFFSFVSAETFIIDGMLYGIGSEEDTYYDEKWEIPEGTAIVLGLSEKYKELVIPSSVSYNNKEYTVTRIATGASVGPASQLRGNEIEKIIIPNTVTTLEHWSLYGCRCLREIIIPSSVTVIELRALPVTDSSGISDFYRCDLERITVDPDNPIYMDINGVLVDKTTSTLLIYPANKKDTNFTIPDSIVRIDATAFRGNGYIQVLSLPNTITELGDRAFSGCGNLKKVFLPSSVINLDMNAFISKGSTLELIVSPDSAGEQYAKEHDVYYSYAGQPETIEELIEKGGKYQSEKKYYLSLHAYLKLHELLPEETQVKSIIGLIYRLLGENAYNDNNGVQVLHSYNNMLKWYPFSDSSDDLCYKIICAARLFYQEWSYYSKQDKLDTWYKAYGITLENMERHAEEANNAYKILEARNDGTILPSFYDMSYALFYNHAGLQKAYGKKYREAIACFQKSIDCCKRLHLEMTDDYIIYNENIATMYEELQNHSGAIPYYQEALLWRKKMTSNPDDEVIQQLEENLSLR